MATVKGHWNHVAMDPGSGLIIQKTETLVEKNVMRDLPGGGRGGRGWPGWPGWAGVAGVAGVAQVAGGAIRRETLKPGSHPTHGLGLMTRF